MTQPTYMIGIDLGTTNCTLAYTKIEKEAHQLPVIEQFKIAQMTAMQTEGHLLSLPSFIYFPLDEEKKSGACALSWNKERPFTVGRFAKERGAEIASRVISSAKSWLCHTGLNRREACLPLNASDSSIQISPLQACAELLRHLKEAWNEEHQETLFNDQTVLITVPASFDPSARQLIQEAAEMASYPSIILLEEPQAAFYAWLNIHAEEWRTQLKVGDTVLVIDCGGGTTDFSLIDVQEENGNLSLNRLAVGSHLLLGGDNIDLSLAYFAQQKLEEEGHSVDQWQFQSLIHQCRQAKEQLLGEKPPKSVEVTILGRGSKLIGNTIKVALTQADVQTFIVDGFIPLIQPSDYSIAEKQTGIQQIGLPYVKDPRISAQLAKFLSMTGESDNQSVERFILPTHVLFNGGTLKASALRQQLMTLLNNWATQLNKPAVQELPGADLDFAVSRGAAYYGLARAGQAIRIRGGTSRSYFIGVEDAIPAVPGMMPPLKAICIVPFGLEEGEEVELQGQEFSLVVGELATFRFFSHATPTLKSGEEAVVGTVISKWKTELTELPSIEAWLDKNEDEGKVIRVKLKSKVTELGVLELWCVAVNGREWKLEFDVRQPQALEASTKA